QGFSTVVLTEEGKPILQLFLKDALKKEAKILTQNLSKKDYNLFLLSGDKSHIVSEIGNKLGFPKSQIHAEMGPESKAQYISRYPNSLFVGDGANDSLAFNEAKSSIATHGSVEMSLRVANIFLSNDNIFLVSESLTLAKKAVLIIKRNLGFSLVYNISGAVLAALGLIGPLEAAVLMPLSSLTVLGNTLLSTRERKN
ncbi:MAG: HAD-IC family P-type ATPase, partial [Halobacteriovoraceae bacterium]|nr:HAD-IC family P-type ATPase [Halobacteriovoraceae bacterium]